MTHNQDMSTRPYSELRDSVMESWNAETQELHKQATSYFQAISDQQLALGQALAKARKVRSLTQAELDKLAGVNQAEISRIENGQGNPTGETLIRLTTALSYKIEVVPA